MPVTALLGLAMAMLPSWDVTFTPSASASYLDRPNLAVVVVAAGPVSPSTQAAAAALAQALRTSQRTRFVMTGEGLAVQPTDPDVRIVQLSAALPVDVVLVVRTFPGPTETAVVVLYTKEGAALTSMAGTLGQPLPARGVTPPPPAAVPPSPVPPPPPPLVTPAPAAAAVTPEPQRPAAAFGSVDLRITPSRRDPDVLVQRGKPLEGSDLYDAVGRPDLKSQYGSRVVAKVLSLVGGGALLAAGTITFLVGLNDRCAIFDASTRVCLRGQTIAQPNILAAAFGVAGLAGIVFGIAFPAHPLNGDERRQLVDDFNKRQDAGQKSEAPSARLRVAMGLLPGGVSGLLHVEF
ncbi:MAG: hypothetical protein MUC96_03865 [Myxococcaceae bacterium]|jgi:hypothetical protein|nr:hypothetical protein [Myxococcaceae bacterium]